MIVGICLNRFPFTGNTRFYFTIVKPIKIIIFKWILDSGRLLTGVANLAMHPQFIALHVSPTTEAIFNMSVDQMVE